MIKAYLKALYQNFISPSVYMLIYIYVRLIFDIFEMDTVGFDVRNI